MPSNPQDVFLSHSVKEDCSLADEDRGLAPGTTLTLFSALAPTISADTHPRDLSTGQQLALALAIALASNPQVLLLDEPTRGLDGRTKELLLHELELRTLNETTVILATHDIELVAEVADYVVLLKDGRVQAQGFPSEILGPKFGYHTITSEVFSPLPLFTLDDVRSAFQHA